MQQSVTRRDASSRPTDPGLIRDGRRPGRFLPSLILVVLGLAAMGIGVALIVVGVRGRAVAV